MKGSYMLRLEVYQLVCDKYNCLFGVQLLERAFPSLKVNTAKCLFYMMKLASNQEFDSLPRMSCSIALHLLSFMAFAHQYLQARTLACCVSASLFPLCGKDNSLHSGDRLRQARARYSVVWSFVFCLTVQYMTVVWVPDTQRRVHLALLGHILALFFKAIIDLLNCNRKWTGCCWPPLPPCLLSPSLDV